MNAPKILGDEPTWCRVHAGAGVSLPHRDKDGNLTVLSTAVQIHLRYWGIVDRAEDVFTYLLPDGLDRVEVWQVAERAWSPGDRIEIGPLPHGVIVIYGVDRNRVAA